MRSIGTVLFALVALVAAVVGLLAFQKMNFKPNRYVARPGDTVQSIADAHGITTEQLTEWNWGVEDPIAEKQVVLIWPGGYRPEVEEVLDAIALIQAGYGQDAFEDPLGGAMRRDPDGTPHPALVTPPPKECKQFQRIEPIRPGEKKLGQVGLEARQINKAMNRQLKKAGRCAGLARSYGYVYVEVEVGCDGVVREAHESRRSGYDKKFIDCLCDVISHAAFPAHDSSVPVTFEFPVEIRL